MKGEISQYISKENSISTDVHRVIDITEELEQQWCYVPSRSYSQVGVSTSGSWVCLNHLKRMMLGCQRLDADPRCPRA